MAATDRRRTLMNAMSRMMLEGWGMSSSVCTREACATPLLRNRTGELYCAGCDMRVVVQAGPEQDGPDGEDETSLRSLLRRRTRPADEPTQAPAPAPSAASIPSPTRPAPSPPRHTAVDAPAPAPAAMVAPAPSQTATPVAAPAPSPARPPTPSTNVASQRLGAKLLAGWRMLSDTCGDCGIPLMQPRNEARRQCVGCERWFMPESSVPVAAPGGSHVAPAVAAAPQAASAPIAPSPVRPAPEPSAAAANQHYDDDDDAEAHAFQLRLLQAQRDRTTAREAGAARIAAGSSGHSAASSSEWADALAEVNASAAADAARARPAAVHATNGPRSAAAAPASASDPTSHPTSAGGSPASAYPSAPASASAGGSAQTTTIPIVSSRILPAPSGWASLSDEQLATAAASAAGGAVRLGAGTGAAPSNSSSISGGAAATAAAAAPSAQRQQQAQGDEPRAIPGALDGNVGPSGRMTRMTSRVYSVAQPEPDRVTRMAAALEVAQRSGWEEDEGVDEDEEADAIAARVLGRPLASALAAARPSASSPLTSGAAAMVEALPGRDFAPRVPAPAPAPVAAPAALTAAPAIRPAPAVSATSATGSSSSVAVTGGGDPALAALCAQLAREKAAIVALGAQIVADAHGHAGAALSEAMAAAASRVSRLAGGIEALQRM